MMRIDEKIDKHLGSGSVSLKVEMPAKMFQDLEAELNIKSTMGQLNPKTSNMHKLAILFVLAVKKGEKSIKIKGV
jgi:hypothetical protein